LPHQTVIVSWALAGAATYNNPAAATAIESPTLPLNFTSFSLLIAGSLTGWAKH
jgi:hypothetical protein